MFAAFLSGVVSGWSCVGTWPLILFGFRIGLSPPFLCGGGGGGPVFFCLVLVFGFYVDLVLALC